MSPEQKALVQMSWRAALPIADAVASLFYHQLFAGAPETRILFAKADPVEQRRKLIGALTLVVNGLDELDELAPTLRELGTRHVSYGVEASQYDAVGAAFLSALERALGQLWNTELKVAWSSAYDKVARIMREAAYTPGSSIAEHHPIG